MEATTTTATSDDPENDSSQWVSLELALGGDSPGEAAFDLEAAVCSHGLFMMAPNRWDPLSKTLLRPLRLAPWDPLHPSDSPSPSALAHISQPRLGPRRLLVRVRAGAGASALTPRHEEALLGQVSRMLRLSESDERICSDFRRVYDRSSAVGRVFRSPNLFEDMVKCILLCNCSWPRSLSMAQALCDLQLELQAQSASAKTSDIIPKTPAGKEPKRMVQRSKASKCLAAQFAAETKPDLESHSSDMAAEEGKAWTFVKNCSIPSSLLSISTEDGSCRADSDYDSILHPMLSRDADLEVIGNFPTPSELSKLDENFLAKRCKLGYRAKRILKLAQGIVEGRIQLGQMEEACKERSLSSYSKLDEQLRQIDGFGPFTRANVLMCMGFYHVIPSDSETIRHLKQVHAKNSSNRTIERDVQEMYAKYTPFQFLAYWSELWLFYETRFGKLSEMPSSAYKLITASNMRSKASDHNKRKRRA